MFTKSYAEKDALTARPDNPDETYNWIMQHKNTFDKFKDVQFYKVNREAKTASTINEWSDCKKPKVYLRWKKWIKRLYN